MRCVAQRHSPGDGRPLLHAQVIPNAAKAAKEAAAKEAAKAAKKKGGANKAGPFKGGIKKAPIGKGK